jgi:DNA-binding NarL/FixJ family response regulator
LASRGGKIGMVVSSTESRIQAEIDCGDLWAMEFGFNPSSLTHREMEILWHIARGYLNKQIARNIGLSEQTIKNHVSRILRKLDSSNRTEAVLKATRWGIIPLKLGTVCPPEFVRWQL